MPTKEELEAENERLRAELSDVRATAQGISDGVEGLLAENRALRAELDARPAGAPGAVKLNEPHRPSFGMSEGERAELELRGVATSPWTGERLNAIDSGVEPGTDAAREAAERAVAAEGRRVVEVPDEA